MNVEFFAIQTNKMTTAIIIGAALTFSWIAILWAIRTAPYDNYTEKKEIWISEWSVDVNGNIIKTKKRVV